MTDEGVRCIPLKALRSDLSSLLKIELDKEGSKAIFKTRIEGKK
jgi:hypothetical protein